MKLSITLLTHNRLDLLKKCVTSLLEQKLESAYYEIIILDNASSDNTSEYLKKLSLDNENISVIFQKKNLGPGRGRNILIKNASYDIIAMIDDDCVADPYWAKSIVTFFSRHPSEMVMIGRLDNFNRQSITGEAVIYRNRLSLKKGLYYKSDTPSKINEIPYADMFSTGNCAFRKSVLKKTGYFWKYPYGEDRDMKFRMQIKGYNIVYNQNMVVKHIFTDSIIKNFRKDFKYGRYEYYFRKKWEKRFYKIGKRTYTINIKPLTSLETFHNLIKKYHFKGLRMYIRFIYGHLASSLGFYYEKYVALKKVKM